MLRCCFQDLAGAEEAIDALTEAQVEEFKQAFALFDKVRVCARSCGLCRRAPCTVWV